MRHESKSFLFRVNRMSPFPAKLDQSLKRMMTIRTSTAPPIMKKADTAMIWLSTLADIRLEKLFANEATITTPTKNIRARMIKPNSSNCFGFRLQYESKQTA